MSWAKYMNKKELRETLDNFIRDYLASDENGKNEYLAGISLYAGELDKRINAEKNRA